MGQLTASAFDIRAHRGGAALAPENTLAALDNALDVGATTLECDVHISADGVPVICHERTCAGQIVPRLADLIAERGADEVGLTIETKFDVLHPDESAPRERFAEAELRVLPYTVDNEPMMRHLLTIDVDGLITNRPDLLRDVLASMDQPLPRRYPAPG